MPDAELLRRELLGWFDAFADCVRHRDFAGAESLFDGRVIAFGTRNRIMHGLAELRERQWRPTWSTTREFRFLADTIHIHICPAGTLGWGAAQWVSRGEPAGRPGFDRSGRASLAFERDRGCWRCVHSHFSMTPSGDL